jgi:hypothetical protein
VAGLFNWGPAQARGLWLAGWACGLAYACLCVPGFMCLLAGAWIHVPARVCPLVCACRLPF